jgi:hypothetical protein
MKLPTPTAKAAWPNFLCCISASLMLTSYLLVTLDGAAATVRGLLR